jgi:hypothetical protein
MNINQNSKVVKRCSECRLYKLTEGQAGRQAGRQQQVLRGCASKNIKRRMLWTFDKN